MTKRAKLLGIPVLALFLTVAGAPLLDAQIANPVRATINHSFIVGNTTLPPGQYTFRMLQGSDLSAMVATNDRKDTSVEFLVRESIDPNTPHHSELVFNRYGNKEFLTKVYESGSRAGVAVMEPSRQELRLQKQGQHPVEHTEEQHD